MKQVLDIMQTKTYQIPGFVFENYKKLKMNEKELIVLISLFNNQEGDYNPKMISETLNIKLESFLEIVNSLEEKGLLKIKLKNENNITFETIDLSLLFEKCFYIIDKKDNKSDIYSKYEKELGRTI